MEQGEALLAGCLGGGGVSAHRGKADSQHCEGGQERQDEAFLATGFLSTGETQFTYTVQGSATAEA